MINISLSKKILILQKNPFNVNTIKINNESNYNRDIEMKDGNK